MTGAHAVCLHRPPPCAAPHEGLLLPAVRCPLTRSPLATTLATGSHWRYVVRWEREARDVEDLGPLTVRSKPPRGRAAGGDHDGGMLSQAGGGEEQTEVMQASMLRGCLGTAAAAALQPPATARLLTTTVRPTSPATLPP